MNSTDKENNQNRDVFGYQYKGEFTKNFRPKDCPNPIGIELRDQTTKIDVDMIPGVVFDIEPTVFPEQYFWTLDQNSNYSIQNGFHFEFRFKCDRNVQSIFGYMSNQKLPSTDSPTEGITIPKLASSKSGNTVGMCVFKHNNEIYPSSILENERSTGWTSLTCRTLVESDYHGGVNFKIETDKNADFDVLPQRTDLDSDLWLFDNDLTAIHNSYIAPAITSISKSKGSKHGGYQITITGNKFTEKPIVKIGFQDCKIISFDTKTVVCEVLQEETLNGDLCSDKNIYPGNPGLSATMYNAKINGNTFSLTFNNDETHPNFAWKGKIEDGWVSAAPKSAGRGWHVGNSQSSLEGAEFYDRSRRFFLSSQDRVLQVHVERRRHPRCSVQF
jgi:hypothetical protein